jgi:hypothetical protein
MQDEKHHSSFSSSVNRALQRDQGNRLKGAPRSFSGSDGSSQQASVWRRCPLAGRPSIATDAAPAVRMKAPFCAQASARRRFASAPWRPQAFHAPDAHAPRECEAHLKRYASASGVPGSTLRSYRRARRAWAALRRVASTRTNVDQLDPRAHAFQ